MLFVMVKIFCEENAGDSIILTNDQNEEHIYNAPSVLSDKMFLYK